MSGKRPPIAPRRVVVPIFRARQGKAVDLQPAPPPQAPAKHRPARVAHMLALAIRIEKMIASGELRDRAHAAANLGFTRARITQLLALTLLAPDIEEDILFLEVEDGVERITERALRDVVCIDDWSEQRRRWQALLDTTRGVVARARAQPEVRRERPAGAKAASSGQGRIGTRHWCRASPRGASLAGDGPFGR